MLKVSTQCLNIWLNDPEVVVQDERDKMKNLMLGFCLIIFVGCANSNAYEKPTVRIVGEAQMTKLPNGNYEVTPRWIKDRFNAENSMIKQLEDCREGGR